MFGSPFGLLLGGNGEEEQYFHKDELYKMMKENGTWFNQDKHPLGKFFAPTSCKVTDVFVKDDTTVKKGEPLLVLDRPLPPSLYNPLSTSCSSPMREHQKRKIKDFLEKRQLINSGLSIIPLPETETTRYYPSNEDHVFDKYGIVVQPSDHLFSSHTPETPLSVDWVKKIKQERILLQDHLPDTIFVRVYGSRMDLLRAAIIGPKGTPYHDAIFFFDVRFPSNYPHSPPLVRFHSGVPGISTHMNKCGDVRLYLVNRHGRRENMWVPGTSNLLQLLVSIQGLIFNPKPYFNGIANAKLRGTIIATRWSFLFNENTVIKTLETMVYTMNKPPKDFEKLVVGHFRMRVHDILMACKAYFQGLQEVGCLVSDDTHRSSIKFKRDIISCIKPLVEVFDKIGAKEAHQYLYLTEKKTALPANALPNVNEDTPAKKRKADEQINDAKKKARKDVAVDEGTTDSAKKESKVFVDEGISDSTSKESKDVVVDEGTSDSAKKESKAAVDEVRIDSRQVFVDEGTSDSANKESKDVVVDEGTSDSAKKESKDYNIYPPHTLVTMRASFDCVITKVLVNAGMEVEKGQPLYVSGPKKTEDILLDIYSCAPIKESKVEKSMTRQILSSNRASRIGIFSMEDGLVDSDLDISSSMPDVLKRYENMKNFDYVTDIPDHFFSAQIPAMNQANKVQRIHEEWAILKKQLPETIFVRVSETRMDLLRAVIIGPQGSPYRDGLFFFDLCFPNTYPHISPLVHYHSGCLSINPNLSKCGKVILSLPKTSDDEEVAWESLWESGSSNVLQLLVSIQNQILNRNPIFNDHTYAMLKGSVYGEVSSVLYNENIVVKSLKTMVYLMNKPPKHFEDFVVGHFHTHLRAIMATCNMKAVSVRFKKDLDLCSKLLVSAFNKIGAKVPQEFLPAPPLPAHV